MQVGCGSAPSPCYSGAQDEGALRSGTVQISGKKEKRVSKETAGKKQDINVVVKYSSHGKEDSIRRKINL